MVQLTEQLRDIQVQTVQDITARTEEIAKLKDLLQVQHCVLSSPRWTSLHPRLTGRRLSLAPGKQSTRRAGRPIHKKGCLCAHRRDAEAQQVLGRGQPARSRCAESSWSCRWCGDVTVCRWCGDVTVCGWCGDVTVFRWCGGVTVGCKAARARPSTADRRGETRPRGAGGVPQDVPAWPVRKARRVDDAARVGKRQETEGTGDAQVGSGTRPCPPPRSARAERVRVESSCMSSIWVYGNFSHVSHVIGANDL